MSASQDTLWERFLAPIARFVINEEELRRYAESVDWEKECDSFAAARSADRFHQQSVHIPSYYSSQNFHGIKGGYLTSGAAVTYDAITQYVLPPNETLVRQALINAIQGKPRRILDLGCGTGSTTLMLKQAFPEAEVIGLDLSPYMLVRAEHKAQAAGLGIKLLHGLAENTGFPDSYFDVVTASLLFHETPPTVSQAILNESFRLLTVGGEAVILDGNQKTLRQLEWLNNVFEEPYIRDYAAGSVDAWMGAAGFEAVQTQDLWLIHQVNKGVKPIQHQSSVKHYSGSTLSDDNWEGIPAFGTSASA